MSRKLPREEYLEDTASVARRLLGCTLARRYEGQVLAGRIVETEAYLGERDLGAHPSRSGRTPRVAAMYGPPGRAYVYLIYGMYHCFNVVCRPEGVPEAVLVRAIEPAEGIATMRRLRRNPATDVTPSDEKLCNGPGKLCRALAIDMTLYGADLCSDALWIEEGAPLPDDRIVAGPRIGIDYAGDWVAVPLRFHERGSRWVSR